MRVIFQNVDVLTFRLKEAQAWLSVSGVKSTGAAFRDVIRRLKDKEYASVIHVFNKSGILPSNTVISFWGPFQAITQNAELLSRQGVSWISSEPDTQKYVAWGLCTHSACAAGARISLEFYGTTAEQLTQHVMTCITHLASGQSFTDPELEITFCLHYPEQIGRFGCSELSNALNWRRIRLTEFDQYVCMQKGTSLSPLFPQSQI